MPKLENPIQQHRNFVTSQIEKSFDNELQKARSGVYADTPENRKLSRVGQQYGGKKKDDNNQFDAVMQSFDKLLKPTDDWEDEDWNDDEMNKKLKKDITNLIRKHKISKKQFESIAKRYQWLDLSYTDYIPNHSKEYNALNN